MIKPLARYSNISGAVDETYEISESREVNLSTRDEFLSAGLAGQFQRQLNPVFGASFARFHLAAIVDSAEDAIISKDLGGVVQSWNPGAERMFGYTAAEMIGRPILRLLPKGKEGEEIGILARLRAGERLCNFQTVRRHKNGQLIHVSLTISPVRDEEGRIIGASKIARDVTAERESMIAQNALIDRLQKALAEIKTLRGLLPICMHCKKIRDDHGFWQQIEAYFHAHTNVEFSHGLCPECVVKHYDDLV